MADEFSILIIDDEADFRTRLLRLFDGKAVCALSADGKSQALKLLADQGPELVFVDLDLADSQGVELLRFITRQYPKMLTIAMSADNSQETVIGAFQAGAQDFIRKEYLDHDFSPVYSRLGSLVYRRKNKHFRPGLLQSTSLDLKLNTCSSAVSPAVEAILHLLAAFYEDRILRSFELALHEAIRNAFEHGNLGITSAEKIAHCNANTFDEEIEKRSKEAQAQGKQIYISVKVSDVAFSCTIIDQGDGFDWRSLPDPLLHPETLLRPNGRGVLLMRKFFDEVLYNEKGNAVELRKKRVPER